MRELAGGKSWSDLYTSALRRRDIEPWRTSSLFLVFVLMIKVSICYLSLACFFTVSKWKLVMVELSLHWLIVQCVLVFFYYQTYRAANVSCTIDLSLYNNISQVFVPHYFSLMPVSLMPVFIPSMITSPNYLIQDWVNLK